MREPKDMWCPLGRISIQEATNNGGVDAVSTGAFNLITMSVRNGAEQRYMASTCLGIQCPLYRKSLFSCGYCGLANVNSGPWFFMGLVLAGAIIALCYLL